MLGQLATTIETIIEGVVNLFPLDTNIGLFAAVITKMTLQIVLNFVVVTVIAMIVWILFSITLVTITGDRKATVKLTKKMKNRFSSILFN